MTRLAGQSRVVRETCAVVKHRPLVVELSALILRIRPKGALGLRIGLRIRIRPWCEESRRKRARRKADAEGA